MNVVGISFGFAWANFLVVSYKGSKLFVRCAYVGKCLEHRK